MNQGLKKLISSRHTSGGRAPDLIKVSRILPETKSTEAIKVIKRLRVPLNQLTCLMNLLSSRAGWTRLRRQGPREGITANGLVWGLLRGPPGGTEGTTHCSGAKVESEPKGCRETGQIWSRMLCVCRLFTVPLWDSVSTPGVCQ